MYEKISVMKSAYLSEIIEQSIVHYLETYETEPLCIFLHPDTYTELEEEWGREPNNFMGVKIEILDKIDDSSIFLI
jgi:hypothetical protein